MEVDEGSSDGAPRIGRQPATSNAQLSHIGLQLFIEHGFDETTVDDIAAAAGIGRRTFFRYFASKNDLPWGDFEGMIASMRGYLAALPDDVDIREALRTAVIEFNRFPADEVSYHRERMRLLLNVPSLVAHSTLRYADWRQVIADYVAERSGLDPEDLVPQTTAWAMLAASLAAYEQWLRHDDADLIELLGVSLRLISTGFDLTELSDDHAPGGASE
ncbi:mycofactocin system transcriptional regulator [Frondihabitans sp. PAMC 28766]|uniref:mycofactocin system transcriptional regulator n=1 Tax=Frondihabitans sp. PAMC 28766 TaxID=1795630 RepID=UPI001EF4D1DB|nr:mycofactocin system transcriptional regulator [Frondihabitans sp. PAMC 28766]